MTTPILIGIFPQEDTPHHLDSSAMVITVTGPGELEHSKLDGAGEGSTLGKDVNPHDCQCLHHLCGGKNGKAGSMQSPASRASIFADGNAPNKPSGSG